MAASAITFSSYPEAQSFDCCRRRISEATRISRPSAPLAAKVRVAPAPRASCCASRCSLQVAPRAAPSGFTGDRSSRRVEARILRRCRLIVSGLPRTAILRYRRRPGSGLPQNLYLPAPADESHRVSPVCSPSGFARENLRVTPKLLDSLAPPIDLAPHRRGASVLRWCR